VDFAKAATFCISTEQELQTALLQAKGNGEDDVIRIVQGTYTGNFVYSSYENYSLTIEGGYTSGCATRELNPANTVLDGGQAGTVLVLSCNQSVDIKVEGLTVQNGKTVSNPNGGGLYVYTNKGDITLTDNIINGNSTTGYGGGVYVSGATTVMLTSNTITNNSTSHIGGGFSVFGSPIVTFTNNTIRNNSGNGGGVNIEAGTTVTLNDNLIENNISTIGAPDSAGGLRVSTQTLYLTNNTIVHNQTGGGGGGVGTLGGGGIAVLKNNFIYKNTTNGVGGGVQLRGGFSNIILTNNIIADNTAVLNGGGLYIYRNTFTLTNNTLSGNIAQGNGGGIWVELYADSDFINIYNNIIWNNSAVKGGDLYVNNDANNNYFYSQVNLFNNDFDQSATGFYITEPPSSFFIDPSNLDNKDPLFADVSNGNYHLNVGSPCIDKGDSNAPEIPLTDKDGQPRIGIVDIGAYEVCSILGDINKDCNVDISDVILDLRRALCLDWCGVPPSPCSDINGDGVDDIFDVILKLRMALGFDPLKQCTG